MGGREVEGERGNDRARVWCDTGGRTGGCVSSFGVGRGKVWMKGEDPLGASHLATLAQTRVDTDMP